MNELRANKVNDTGKRESRKPRWFRKAVLVSTLALTGGACSPVVKKPVQPSVKSDKKEARKKARKRYRGPGRVYLGFIKIRRRILIGIGRMPEIAPVKPPKKKKTPEKK